VPESTVPLQQAPAKKAKVQVVTAQVSTTEGTTAQVVTNQVALEKAPVAPAPTVKSRRRSSAGSSTAVATAKRGGARRGAKWTDDEDEELRRLVADNTLGNKRGAKWTDDEDEELRRLVADNTLGNKRGAINWDNIVPYFPGRSLMGVRRHYNRLLNADMNRQTQEEDQPILDGLKEFLTFEQIAEKLGKEPSYIKKRYRELHLIRNGGPSKGSRRKSSQTRGTTKVNAPWTDEENEIILRRYCAKIDDPQIAEYLPWRSQIGVVRQRRNLMYRNEEYYSRILAQHQAHGRTERARLRAAKKDQQDDCS
jgi:hypothetical protein